MSKVTPENEPLVNLFQSIGLTQSKALEAAKSAKPAAILKEIIDEKDIVAKGSDEKRAGLLVALSNALSKSPGISKPGKDYVLDKILNGDLKSVDQVNGKRPGALIQTNSLTLFNLLAAVKYVDTNSIPIDDADFNKACGVGKYIPYHVPAKPWIDCLPAGFSITPKELLDQVQNYLASNPATGWTSLGTTLNVLRGSSEFRWANPLEVKDAVEKVFLETFGPKVAKAKVKVCNLFMLYTI